METLSVGMYVRTLNGIVKIDKIQDNVMEDTKGHLHCGDFIKASYNIIDILEIGDMVNSLIVTKISEDNETKKKYINLYGSLCEWENEDIKSVITHEQMEQMAYKVVE